MDCPRASSIIGSCHGPGLMLVTASRCFPQELLIFRSFICPTGDYFRTYWLIRSITTCRNPRYKEREQLWTLAGGTEISDERSGRSDGEGEWRWVFKAEPVLPEFLFGSGSW
jgi:hypothetical protein